MELQQIKFFQVFYHIILFQLFMVELRNINFIGSTKYYLGPLISWKINQIINFSQ